MVTSAFSDHTRRFSLSVWVGERSSNEPKAFRWVLPPSPAPPVVFRARVLEGERFAFLPVLPLKEASCVRRKGGVGMGIAKNIKADPHGAPKNQRPLSATRGTPVRPHSPRILCDMAHEESGEDGAGSSSECSYVTLTPGQVRWHTIFFAFNFKDR